MRHQANADPTFDGSQRQVQPRGDFLVGALLEIPEHDDLTLRNGKVTDCLHRTQMF